MAFFHSNCQMTLPDPKWHYLAFADDVLQRHRLDTVAACGHPHAIKPCHLARLKVAALWYHSSAGCGSRTWEKRASISAGGLALRVLSRTSRADMTMPFCGL
jgi:hypothetical protein